MHTKTIIILSVTSDIGKFLAHQYVFRGWHVVGTYRNSKHLDDLRGLNNCQLIRCDVTQQSDIARFAAKLKTKRIRWNRFISCVGCLLPAQPFFESDFSQWRQSVEVNAFGQMHVLHGIHALHAKDAKVIFFAGGGTNNAVTDITGYTASKMMLIKMVEYLDAENKDMSFMIVGPGWTNTKIHTDILRTKDVSKIKLIQTTKDLKQKSSTPLTDIDTCIDWLCHLPKKTVSGRNFSVVHDAWQGKNNIKLEQALATDINMYKLRRYKNDFIKK